MNDLQKIQFEMLQTAVNICETKGITYFMVCGSALGAAKYHGFIPWDDDLDIGMFREDYEKFLDEAPKYLPDHLFLQTFKSEKNYTQIFAKIRNSNTTFVEKSVARLDINHGVYIDIFPLDGYPNEKKKQRQLECKKKLYRRLISCNYTATSFKGKILVKCLRLFGVHKCTNRILQKYDALISQYPIASSDLICNHGNWQGRLEYAPKWHYGKGATAIFEGIEVRIPEKHDEYLTQKYGDWRADLPEDQKIGHHYYEILDLNKSYREYKNI